MKVTDCWMTMGLGLAMFAAPVMACAVTAPQMSGGQMAGMQSNAAKKPLLSPPADASTMLDGKAVSVHYNTPLIRGRKIMGGLVPYGKVWRTGANPATLFKTAVDLKIGDLKVPAGTYTLYTLPSDSTWMLIVNKQTGQWGTEYDEKQDLGRVPMKKEMLSQPQEKMSISFEKTTDKRTSLHVRWETTDVSVPIVAQ